MVKYSFLSLFVLAVAFAATLPAFGQDESKPAEAVETKPKPTTVRPPNRPLSPKLQPLSVTIELTKGTPLTGTLIDATQWPMKTSFGETLIPLSAVAGIKLAQEGTSSTTVVLHNGDSITGSMELNLVEIQTEWGKAEINGSHIAGVLFTPGMKWVSETSIGGTRWRLTDDATTAKAPAAGTQSVLRTGFNAPVPPATIQTAPAPPK